MACSSVDVSFQLLWVNTKECNCCITLCPDPRDLLFGGGEGDPACKEKRAEKKEWRQDSILIKPQILFYKAAIFIQQEQRGAGKRDLSQSDWFSAGAVGTRGGGRKEGERGYWSCADWLSTGSSQSFLYKQDVCGRPVPGTLVSRAAELLFVFRSCEAQAQHVLSLTLKGPFRLWRP